MQWWQLVVGVALAGALALLAWRAARMRRRNVEALLSKHGWSRVPEDPTLVDRWRGAPFGQGTNPRATNVISGAYRGHAVLAFDYSYERRHPAGGTVRDVYAVFVVRLPRAVPSLELTPQGLADRGRRLLGQADVTVGDEEFDRAFRIRCHDAGAAALLRPELRRRLLQGGRRPYRFVGDAVLTWELGPIDKYALNATWIEQVFDVLVDLAGWLPPDVDRPRVT